MAVYTQVDDGELIAFLKRFDIGELVSFRGIAEGVENSNYVLQTTSGQFILTLYEKRVAANDLPFFLGLMGHLADRGFHCPTPLVMRDGSHLGELAGRPAAIISFLEGFWPRKPTADHCRAVGGAMAQMHLTSDGFALTRANALGVTEWRNVYGRFADRAETIRPGLSNVIAAEVDHLEDIWPAVGTMPSGVIHADMFPDNVFFRDDHLSGVIDFYFACNDVFAYDLAIAINAWCFEPNMSINLTKGRALLSGYHAVRPLNDMELSALPTLCRGAALRFLLTRAYDWLHTEPSAFVKPHDPVAYLRRLWAHQSISGPEEYGWRPD